MLLDLFATKFATDVLMKHKTELESLLKISVWKAAWQDHAAVGFLFSLSTLISVVERSVFLLPLH